MSGTGHIAFAIYLLLLALLAHSVLRLASARAVIQALKELKMTVDARTQAIVADIQALPALLAAGDAAKISALESQVGDLTSQLADATSTIGDNASAVEGAIASITPTPAAPAPDAPVEPAPEA